MSHSAVLSRMLIAYPSTQNEGRLAPCNLHLVLMWVAYEGFYLSDVESQLGISEASSSERYLRNMADSMNNADATRTMIG